MSDEEIYILECSPECKTSSMLVKLIDRIENKEGCVEKFIIEPLDLPGFKKELEREDLKSLKMGTLYNVLNKIKCSAHWDKWTVLDYFNNPLFHGSIEDILDTLSDLWYCSKVVSLDMVKATLKLNVGLSMYNK